MLNKKYLIITVLLLVSAAIVWQNRFREDDLLAEAQSLFNTPTAQNIQTHTSASLKNKPVGIKNPVFYGISNRGEEADIQPPLLNGRSWISIEHIARQQIKNANSDQEKVLALHNFVVNNFHHDSTAYDHWLTFPMRPLQLLHAWGYGYCSDAAVLLAALAKAAGFDSRIQSLNEHVVVEIYYDGGWHMFDPDMRLIVYNSSNIAGIDDIFRQPQLLLQAGDYYDFHKNAYSQKKVKKTLLSKFIPDYYLSEKFTHQLKKGSLMVWYKKWHYKYFWSKEQKYKNYYSNGVLATSIFWGEFLRLATENTIGCLQDGVSFWVCLSKLETTTATINSFYPLVDGKIKTGFGCAGTKNLFVSADQKNWKGLFESCKNGITQLGWLFPAGPGTKPVYKIYLKNKGLFAPLKVFLVFQFTPMSIFADNGDNYVYAPAGNQQKIKLVIGSND